MESKDFEPVYKIVMPPEPVISPLIYADDSDILYSKHHGKCDRHYKKAIEKRRKKNKNPKTHRKKRK